ncbi:hypothetical protein ACKWTF_009583 [Chironomus riparius]
MRALDLILLLQILVNYEYVLTQNCLSPDGAAGHCINFRKCNFIVNLIIQLQQKQDDGVLNYLKKSICGQDGQDPMVCCPALVFASLTGSYTSSPQTSASPGAIVFGPVTTQRTTSNGSSSSPIFSVPPSPTPQPSPPLSSGTGSLVFGPVTNQNSLPGSPTTAIPTTTSSGPILNILPTNDANKCGMTYALKSRIVGGQTAVPGSYPWLAALGYNITNTTTKISTTQFLCGGTLITQRHVLSAAHCIISTLISARLGAYDITQSPDGYNTIDSNVVTPYVHELYNPQKITYDISIIKLDRILPITSYIRPACIPLTDAVKYRDYTGNYGWVAGWGSTSFGGPSSAILQEVQLPVVALADCAFNYKLYFPNQVFDNNILCAGYPQGGKVRNLNEVVSKNKFKYISTFSTLTKYKKISHISLIDFLLCLHVDRLVNTI